MEKQLNRIEEKLDRQSSRIDAIYVKIGGKVGWGSFVAILISVSGLLYKFMD